MLMKKGKNKYAFNNYRDSLVVTQGGICNL